MVDETMEALASTDESAAILEQMLADYVGQRAEHQANLEYFEAEERGALYEEGCEVMAAEESSSTIALCELVEEASAASWTAEIHRRRAVPKAQPERRGVAAQLRGVAPRE